MIIKNVGKLQRKHPNYSEEIEIIRVLVDDFMRIVNTDLFKLAEIADGIDWDVKTKRYLLTGGPKEIEYNDPAINDELGRTHGFAMRFEKNCDSPTNIYINHPVLINMITDSNLFDSMSLILLNIMTEFGFEKTGVYSGEVYLEIQNGSIVLKNYEINFEK